MIFSNIKQFFKENKKVFLYFGFFLVLFSLSSDVTFAADKELKDTVAEFANGLMQGIGVLLALSTYLATLFTSPEWVNGTLFGLTDYFKTIWILVSNVVYFVFAFILIWIAFMNIIGNNTDQYQLKQALPKFIVGVLIVPFSWFLVQFILSISAILTVASLSLPFDTFPQHSSVFDKIKVPVECTLNLTSVGKSDVAGGSSSGTGSTGFVDCDNSETKSVTELINGDNNSVDSIFGIISVYTYGILAFDNVDDITQNDLAKGVKTLGDLIVKILFDVLFVAIYAILMITLGIVLLIRGIYIWIYIMISPLFGLMYFFDKKDGGEGFFAKFNIKEFIALAMVPVYTMLALSFGLLFIYVTGNGMTQAPASGTEKTLTEDGFQVGSFKLNIPGTIGTQKNELGTFMKEIGDSGLGVVGGMIMKIFGIIILWGTVMAAMRTSEITKTITQPIYDFGSKVGGIVTSAPGNMPIFNGQSANSMGQIAGKYQQAIGQTSIDRANKFSQNAPFLQENSETTAALSKVTNNLKGMSRHESELKKSFEDWMKAGKGDTSKLKSAAALEAIKSIGTHFGMDTEKFSNNTEQDIINTIMRPIEGKLDGSSVKGMTTDLTGINGEMTTASFKTMVKDLHTGTVNPSNDNVNSNLKFTHEVVDGGKKRDLSIGSKSIGFLDIDGAGKITDGTNSDMLHEMKKLLTEGLSKAKLDDIISDIPFSDSARLELKKELVKGLFYNASDKSYTTVPGSNGYSSVNSYKDML